MKLLDLLKENKKAVTIGSLCFLSGWLIMGTIDNWLRDKYEKPRREIEITTSVIDSKDKAVMDVILGIYEKQIEEDKKVIGFYQKLTNYLIEKIGLKKKRDLEKTSQENLYKL